MTDGLGESCGRFLADLGAEVVRVERPGGSASRRSQPVESGISIPFALNNANKRVVVLDLDSGPDRTRFLDQVAAADILVESTPNGLPTGTGGWAPQTSWPWPPPDSSPSRSAGSVRPVRTGTGPRPNP